METQNSLQQHPCKVYYPHGGRHYLLQWWTHDLQNVIILAKSKQTLDHTVQRVISHYGEKNEVKIIEGLEIDIVSPSKSLIEKSIVRARQQEINNFAINVLCQVSSEFREGKTLPSVFSPCPGEDHCLCEDDACIEGLSLNLPKDQFYDKYHELWNKEWNVRPLLDKKAMYSRARYASDKEEVWFAKIQHSFSGIELFQVETDNESTSSVNFYFVKLNSLDISEYQKLASLLAEEKKKKRDLQSEHYQKRAEHRRTEMLDKIWKVFG